MLRRTLAVVLVNVSEKAIAQFSTVAGDGERDDHLSVS